MRVPPRNLRPSETRPRSCASLVAKSRARLAREPGGDGEEILIRVSSPATFKRAPVLLVCGRIVTHHFVDEGQVPVRICRLRSILNYQARTCRGDIQLLGGDASFVHQIVDQCKTPVCGDRIWPGLQRLAESLLGFRELTRHLVSLPQLF